MLVFKAESHEYLYEDKKLRGVTSVLQGAGLIDFSQVRADIMERAQVFGTAVHRATELYDTLNLKEDTLDCALVPYLEAWKRFRFESNVELLEVEKPVYSLRYGYAGTPDRIVLMNGYVTVVDIKTNVGLHPASAIQTSAYENAYNEKVKAVKAKARRRLVVQLCDDGTYKLPKKEFFRPTDFSVFLSALTLVNYKERVKL